MTADWNIVSSIAYTPTATDRYRTCFEASARDQAEFTNRSVEGTQPFRGWGHGLRLKLPRRQKISRIRKREAFNCPWELWGCVLMRAQAEAT